MKEKKYIANPWFWTEVLAMILLLYLGRSVFVPLAFSVLFSLSIYPAVHFLETKGLSRSLAILPPMLLLVAVVAGFLMLLIWILNDISFGLPALWPLIENTLHKFSIQLENEIGITAADQLDFLKKQLELVKEKAGALVVGSLTKTAEALIMFILIPILVYLLLYNRQKLLNFLTSILDPEWATVIRPAAHKAVFTFFRYIQGLLIVYILVGLLNSLGLWALGIPNPWLFGFMAAILTAIPFVGIMIGSIPPLMLAIVLYDSWMYPAGVIAVFAIVQYLEANLIFPFAVGNRLNLNTLMVIIAMLAGSLIWGASGLIIFLPALAIFRVIAEEIPALKNWADLLGNK